MTASIAAVGALGWYCAIEYYDLKTMTGTIYTSAQLSEKSLEADDFRQRFAEASDKIEKLESDLVIARATPTDSDWNTLCFRFLKTYGTTISVRREIKDWAADFFGNVPQDPTTQLLKLKDILDNLEATKTRTNSYLVGAGLMKPLSQEGVEYVILTKYPSHGLNWKTGEVRKLDKE